MNDIRPSGPAHEATSRERSIDWEGVLVLVRRTVCVHLRATERDEVDDLTAEAAIRVIRAVRLEPPRNLDALATAIAQRTCADYVRRCRRQAALQKAVLTGGTHDAASRRAGSGDELDRLRFVILEFFDGTPCAELANVFFAGRNWKDWAREIGGSHEAERQKWSRCVKKLRAAARKCGTLSVWIGREDERE